MDSSLPRTRTISGTLGQQEGNAAEQVFAIIGLLFMLGALTGLFNDLTAAWAGGVGGLGPNTGGNLRFQVFSATLYLICIAILLRRPYQIAWLLMRNKSLFLLVGVVVLSTIWSIESPVTLRRAIALVGTTSFGVYLALRFRPGQLLHLLAVTFLLAGFISLVAVILFPEIGRHVGDAHDGLWRGVFGHKSAFGRMMALGTTLFLFLALTHSYPRSLTWLGLSLCMFLMIMSGSRTAWVAALGLCLATWALIKLRRPEGSARTSPIAFLIVITAILATCFLLVTYFEVALELLGKDSTLTGRTGMWEKAINAGSDRPILGYGYRVFWSREHGGFLFNRYALSAGFGHAHNTFLDIWLDLGFVGIGLFATTVLIAGKQILARLTQAGDVMSVWFALLIIFILVTGATDQTILQQGSIEWTLYVSTLVYLSVPYARSN